MTKKKKIIIAAVAAVIVIAAAMIIVKMVTLDKDAAHISYDADENYGAGNYVYSTVTLTGSGMGCEKVIPVKDLENTAYKDSDIGEKSSYSLMTSGGIFSVHKFTGVKLYDYLKKEGMTTDLPDGTSVKVVSKDGYTIELTLGDIRDGKYNCYDSRGASDAKKEGVPVMLAFGSDGVPLTGPTGSQDLDHKFTEKEGYDKKADNIGGPLRLIVGQHDSEEYNAPQCAKWVQRIVVGRDEDYARHKGSAAAKTALKVSVYDADNGNRKIKSGAYDFAGLENFAAGEGKYTDRNYYGKKDFYEGADLWYFLLKKVKISSMEGKVRFTYDDGKTETVDMSYLRNLNGDFENYVTEKGGRTITCVKPALGYAVNGAPAERGELWALLPANGSEKKNATVSRCTSLDVYLGKGMFSGKNPNAADSLKISGSGVEKARKLTVADLEAMPDIAKKTGSYAGVDLAGLLESTGLTADAARVTCSGAAGSISYKLSDLQDGSKKVILATRKNGTALSSAAGGAIRAAGDASLKDVTGITVAVKKGQWTHSSGVYRRYLSSKLKVSGSAVKKSKTYTLKELEHLGKAYTVKDTFAASSSKNIYQGVVLRKLVEANLKNNSKRPSKIIAVGKDGYKKSLSVASVYNGIESKYQSGEDRDIILAYSMNGYPLVADKKSAGYKNGNGFGPIRLVVENQISSWVKRVTEIRIVK